MHVPKGACAAALRGVAATVSVALVAGTAAACSGSPALSRAAARRVTGDGLARSRWLPVAQTRAPSPAVSVLAGAGPDVITARFARTLFATSPVVVIAAERGTALPAAVKAARAAHAPLLLAPAVTPRLAAAVLGLRPRAVLAAGLPPAALAVLAARLPGVRVVSRTAGLPVTAAPAPLRRVGVLVGVPVGVPVDHGRTDPEDTAVTVTAESAGAAVVSVHGGDPRADPAAIGALARLRPLDVVGVGAQFEPAIRLRSRLAVAETGRQLPGGGQLLFPGRRLVALYGHPGTPGLGMLGQQDLPASMARARRMAAAYRSLSRVPVVPAFEIIATVARASPGADGNYSYQSPVSSLRPWVSRATKAGMYVVLDLQPGRASLLAQAKSYQSLLRQPDVGLALDPEWKLQPGQKPLHQIGHVDIGEVNSVISWLASLTARYHLPQKLLVLHQFQLSMISGEQDLDTSHDNLAIVIHMDGQGTPGDKLETWNAVTGTAPRAVYLGWKNFLVKDHPMFTPQQTMANTPQPLMISYQ
jgi:hypothetical protein